VYNRYEGLEGVAIGFYKDSPPEKLYENQPFPVMLSLQNKGAYDIPYERMIITFSQDPLYIGGGISPYLPTAYDPELYGQEDAALRGRSLTFPDGEERAFTMPAEQVFYVKPVKGQRESPETEIIASICYPYTTYVSSTVCIDTNLYGQNLREQSCVATPIAFQGGQGAPITITSIEVSAAPVTSRSGVTVVRPRFVVHLENRGDGSAMGPDSLDAKDACLLKVSRELLDTAVIDARLLGAKLQCGQTMYGEASGLIHFQDDAAEIICTLPDAALGDPLLAGTQNFATTLTINVSYYYKAHAIAPLAIERVPGSRDVEIIFDMSTAPGYANSVALASVMAVAKDASDGYLSVTGVQESPVRAIIDQAAAPLAVPAQTVTEEDEALPTGMLLSNAMRQMELPGVMTIPKIPDGSGAKIVVDKDALDGLIFKYTQVDPDETLAEKGEREEKLASYTALKAFVDKHQSEFKPEIVESLPGGQGYDTSSGSGVKTLYVMELKPKSPAIPALEDLFIHSSVAIVEPTGASISECGLNANYRGTAPIETASKLTSQFGCACSNDECTKLGNGCVRNLCPGATYCCDKTYKKPSASALKTGTTFTIHTTAYYVTDCGGREWDSGESYTGTGSALKYCQIPNGRRGFYQDVKCQGTGYCDGKFYAAGTITRTQSTSPTVSGAKTASGTIAKAKRTIAVNNDKGTECYIPYGTKVRMDFGAGNPWNGEYVAEDTGGAINGCRIDVYAGEGKAALDEAMKWVSGKEAQVTVIA
jgi:3D (Asp-Asp-Asp) domain-containing protein